ncbi:IS5 family transposase [Streptomyces tendae]|uniref:IS5 family transposase n=1 Tax=Streptomyces tendae TaxID=1932 RepID=UPI0034081F03
MPLTHAQWARIEPLLPDRTPKRGGRWRDHREVIDAIAFKFQTGTQWVHLPEKYGNWRGVYNRLRMWAVDGTWERVFTAVAQADADEDLNWAVSVDPTIVRAHQHAAGARKKGPGPGRRTRRPRHRPLPRRTDHKDPPRCWCRCRPLAFVLTPGQAGDAPAFTEVISRLRVPRPRGRPRTRPDLVLADKAYSSHAIREHLRKRGIRATPSSGASTASSSGEASPPATRRRHHLPGRTPHRRHLPLVRPLIQGSQLGLAHARPQ